MLVVPSREINESKMWAPLGKPERTGRVVAVSREIPPYADSVRNDGRASYIEALRYIATLRYITILGMVCALMGCPGAWGLDAGLDVSQYAHTAWKVRDGFVRGAIFAIAQTPDGYLWLGTESGLVRFDGVRAVPWQPPGGERLPGNFVNVLLVARDGTLWIGTHKGLASWKGGRLSKYPEIAGPTVTAL